MKKNIFSNSIFLFTILLIIYLTYNNGLPNILNWDTFGYSAYMPLLFINKNVILHDFTFFENINNIYKNTPTLYQFITLENGNVITKYTVGWSILMTPFYFIGHLIAKLFHFKLDGYSFPYQLMIYLGSTFYSILGLHYLKKIVLHFFNDLISAFTFLSIVFGTNYFLMQSISPGSTHNLEFTFLAILIWQTIKFHQLPSIKKGLFLGFLIGIIGTIRPPDLIFGCIPLFWNLDHYSNLKDKIIHFWKNFKKEVIISILSILSILFIQFLYWKITSGHFFINSYNNPGENFDWLTPYTFDFLFSFRKGWLIYSPIMLLAIIGLYYWRKKENQHGNFIILIVLIFIYVVSCWTNWWYAASYSQRPMVDIYPLLAIGLGFFFLHLKQKRFQKFIYFVSLIFILFNLFQSYQYQKGILHPSLMTKDYYFSTFGQLTPPTQKQQKLLLIDRDKFYNERFRAQNEYKKCFTKRIIYPTNFYLNDSIIYTPIIDILPNKISNKDHFWLKMTWKYDGNLIQLEGKIMNIAAMHNSKAYNWVGRSISDSLTTIDTINKTISFDYLSPYFRNENDFLRIGIWKQSGLPIKIKSVLIEGFEKK